MTDGEKSPRPPLVRGWLLAIYLCLGVGALLVGTCSAWRSIAHFRY